MDQSRKTYGKRKEIRLTCYIDPILAESLAAVAEAERRNISQQIMKYVETGIRTDPTAQQVLGSTGNVHAS